MIWPYSNQNGLYKTDAIPMIHYGMLNYRGFKELF